jgi:hypothetical protein
MAGFHLSFSPEPLGVARQREALDLVKGMLPHQAGHSMDTVSDQHTAAALVRYQDGPTWGVSRLLQGRYRLLLCGWAWEDDSASRFSTADEVLEHLVATGWSSGQSLLGQYLFVLTDAVSRTVVVENDLFGLVPCYYRSEHESIVISTEIKAFSRPRNSSLDPLALAEVVRLGYGVTDRTLFSDVKRLPPNHRLTFDGRVRLEALPLPAFERRRPLDDEAIEELNGAFVRYLDRVKPSTRQVSASLSGGLDSRIIVAALVRGGFDVTTFSSGEPGSLECRVAGEFSRLVGATQSTHVFDGRGFPNWFAEAVWVTEGRCPAGHMHFLDAMLSGDFPKLPQFHGLLGDVIIGGDYDARLSANQLQRIDDTCRGMVGGNYWPADSLEAIWGPEMRRDVGDVPERVVDYACSKGPWDDPYSQYLWFRHITRAFGFITPCLGSQVMPWTQLFVPYLDPTFFRIAAGIRLDDVSNREGQIRWAMRYWPEVDRLPRVKDGALIPVTQGNLWEPRIRSLTRLRDIRYAVTRLSWGRLNLPEREGYPAYGQWYRRHLNVREYVNDTLLSKRSLQRGLWREEGLRRLLHDLRIGRDVWYAVSTLLQLEVFLGQQLDGDTPAGWRAAEPGRVQPAMAPQATV